MRDARVRSQSSRSRLSMLTGVACLTLAAACSSDDEPVPFSDPEVAGRSDNPDGTPYPTDNLGGRARAGKQRGDRIPNLTFQGYPGSDRSGGLKTIALADYYDPGQKRAKVMHLMVAAVWCAICDGMTREMIGTKAELDENGVVVVQAIMNGKRQTVGPSLEEVAFWIDRYPTWFTVVIDERAKRVGTFTVVDAVPWNAFIDLRTMEILEAYGGRPVPYRAAALGAVEWVKTHPPSY